MTRTTKTITYNLSDRGRVHTGKSRASLDIPKVVDIINSPKTQEWVKNGDMVGYHGHQIRLAYGMMPPESVVMDTGVCVLHPSVRTVSLSAAKDGTVSHKQEFLDTSAGEYSYSYYKANLGGFSSAMTGDGFFGYDYVLQPNYSTNKGYSLLDSAQVKELMPALEDEIRLIYDSASIFSATGEMAEYAASLEGRIKALLKDKEASERAAYEAKSKARESKGLHVEVLHFDTVLAEMQGDFNSIGTKKQKANKLAYYGRFFG